MFSLFGKRKRATAAEEPLDKKELAIVKVCSTVLTVQRELIADKRVKYDDAFSIGYVWGFVDAMLQNNRIEADVKGFAMISAVFLNVFGQDAAPKLLGRGFRLQESGDKTMLRGMMKGGNECLEWGRTGNPVLGWAEYANGSR